MEYPITAVLGQRGAGKTLFMTYLAHQYHAEGKKIFANYQLNKIDFTHITYEELAELPEWLYDGIVFLDEIHMGADSYEVFKKSNKMITTFATQLRKRRITLYYSTQVFKMATKRLRDQTNYILTCDHTQPPGFVKIQVYEYIAYTEHNYVKTIALNLTQYFNSYDTNEVITYSENSITEGVDKYS
jgi:ABC-type branched-subunit amino acid transport system ATPase component